ncbi:MAG: sulfurtransferase-like selenium metabolism protein YedF [Bacteroidales bacterium]
MKTVDTRGMRCPQPLILLKEALEGLEAGVDVTVLTDNETSLKNMCNYLRDQGVEPGVEEEGGVHTIRTLSPGPVIRDSRPEAYCSTDAPATDYVVCIKGELMGDGDPELGRLLMTTFVDHLKLQKQLPTHVVLYNGGVKLATRQAPTCAALSELEETGIRIVLCGTCVEHYGIQYDLGVGMISNMVVITEILAGAGHVLNP